MNKLDKKLEDILFDKGVIIFADVPGDKKLKDVTSTVVEQIKSVILEALKAEMPNKKDNIKDIRAIWDDTDFAVDWRLGYNRAIDDCKKVCNKLLGDSKNVEV